MLILVNNTAILIHFGIATSYRDKEEYRLRKGGICLGAKLYAPPEMLRNVFMRDLFKFGS